MAAAPARLSTVSRLALASSARHSQSLSTSIASVRRRYHPTPAFGFPKKGSEGKDDMDPQSSEYSKSGVDNDAAANDAAFDPNNTSPEGARKASKDQSLKVSPANKKASKHRPESEGGAEASPREAKDGGSESARLRTSGAGSPAKEGKPPSGSD